MDSIEAIPTPRQTFTNQVRKWKDSAFPSRKQQLGKVKLLGLVGVAARCEFAPEIADGKWCVAYAQRRETLGSQLSGILIRTGSVSLFFQLPQQPPFRNLHAQRFRLIITRLLYQKKKASISQGLKDGAGEEGRTPDLMRGTHGRRKKAL
jgi:hypothetical protein